MKRVLLLSVLMSFYAVIQAQTPINDDWLEVGNTAYNAELKSITFISQDTGFAVGTGGSYLKTVDGGNTWTAYNTGYNYFFNKVIFTNHLTGYISGNLLNESTGKLIKTTDGGNTWQEIYSSSDNFSTMFFLNANIGFVAGYGKVYKTIDAGSNWIYSEPNNCYNINSVFFRTADSGFIAAIGKLHRSDDGGASWTDVLSNVWNQVTFTSASNGYALRGNNLVFRSSDRGSNWIQKGNTLLSGTNGICFSNDTTGLAWSDLNFPGKISKTIDGGQTWVSVFNNSACQVTNISIRSDGVFFACGRGGLIMKSLNKGDTWIILHQGTVPNKLNRMCFSNDSTIFAVGDGGLLLKSTNRATSWTTLNSGVNVNLKAICAISPDTLFILAENGAILKSVNTGQNWIALNTGFSSQTNLKGDILFVTNKIGFAVMDKIYRTADGGNTWNLSYDGTTSFEICAPTPDSLYVASWGNILRSKNAGLSWDTTYSSSGFYTGIDFINSSKIMAAKSNVYIHKTIDGGNSWTEEYIVSSTFGDVSYYDDTTAYVCWHDGYLFKSANNGSTWTQVITGTNRDLSEIYFGPDGTGYILGQDGMILRRTITPTYSIKFDFTDDDGNLLTNANLTINSTSYATGVDSIGGLIADSYNYIVAKPGYLSDTANIYLSSDTTINIILKKFHIVVFNLSNIFSNPIDTAHITLGNNGLILSDASGVATYNMVVKSPTTPLQIVAYGYLPDNASLNILGDTSFSFILQADLDAPLAQAATNIGDLNFTANWQDLAVADSFKLFVSNDNFTTCLTGYNGKFVQGTSIIISGLTAGSGYQYRLKSVNFFGESIFSNTIQVTTTSGINENYNAMINIYPNPASNYIIIESNDKIMEIAIINPLGAEFPLVFNEKENNRVKINTDALCDGIYLIGLRTQGSLIMRKIIINK